MNNDYEVFELSVGTLEFIPSTHQYIFNGIELPSITTILGRTNKNKYAGVPEEVLNRAAEKGSLLHKQIEDYEMTGEESDSIEFRNYRFLKKHYELEAVMIEQPVVIWWNYETNDFATNEEINNGIGVPVSCGRLDQIAKMNKELGILDFKRTSGLDKLSAALQTNLYKIGVLQTYEIDIKWLAVMHLRENVRKFHKLPINQEQVRLLIKGYLESEKQNEV